MEILLSQITGSTKKQIFGLLLVLFIGFWIGKTIQKNKQKPILSTTKEPDNPKPSIEEAEVISEEKTEPIKE